MSADPREVMAEAIREAPWIDRDTPGEMADSVVDALQKAGKVIVDEDDLYRLRMHQVPIAGLDHDDAEALGAAANRVAAALDAHDHDNQDDQ